MTRLLSSAERIAEACIVILCVAVIAAIVAENLGALTFVGWGG